ncbi:MAG: Crp/Fnr family transcriptional regulator [Chloroflexi bacterium]|nr:Crp/Fnr family transcriptional regulator [Chloroflexota bacterium]
MQRHEISECLLASDLLRGQTPSACEAFINRGHLIHTPAQTYLFHQEDPAELCYFLLAGKVRLAQLTPEGKQIVVEILSPKHYFGLFVTLAKQTYSVSAGTIEDSIIYCWDRGTVRKLMLQFPQIALKSIELLTKRFSHLQDRLQKLATERVEQRVAYALLDLSRMFGEKVGDGDEITVKLCRQDLAELAGTNIYSISRIFRKWEEDGIVVSHRQKVVLCNLEHLQLLVEGKSQTNTFGVICAAAKTNTDSSSKIKKSPRK